MEKNNSHDRDNDNKERTATRGAIWFFNYPLRVPVKTMTVQIKITHT